MLRSTSLFVAVCVLASTLIPGALSAQSLGLTQDQGNSLSIEIFKPNLSESFGDYSSLSAVMFLSGRFSVNNKLRVVGDVPFAYTKSDVVFFNFATGGTERISDQTEFIVGNPYVGIEVRQPGSSTFAELGLRFPVASEDKATAAGFGVLSDFDRFEAFLPDILTLQGKINFRQMRPSGIGMQMRFGPTLFVNTAAGGDNTEFFLDYSAQLVYQAQQAMMAGGITGRLLVSEDGLDLGERTVHQLNLAVSLNIGQVHPGALLRLPLDDGLKDAMDFVFGLTFGLDLN